MLQSNDPHVGCLTDLLCELNGDGLIVYVVYPWDKQMVSAYNLQPLD
jgi:hypothetical protein